MAQLISRDNLDGKRIASPEMFLNADLLRHVNCSPMARERRYGAAQGIEVCLARRYSVSSGVENGRILDELSRLLACIGSMRSGCCAAILTARQRGVAIVRGSTKTPSEMC